MPSTLIHAGFAALLAAALLTDDFDARALAVVVGAAVVPDLDTFIGLWLIDGGHRAVLHNLLVPSVLLIAAWVDVRRGADSRILARWGPGGWRLAWVSLFGGWIVAAVLLDAFFNGANLLWPVHDEFIDLSGHLLISDQRGFEQTFIEFERTADGGTAVGSDHSRGSTGEQHYWTYADMGPDADEDTERIGYVFDRGTYMVIALAGYATAGFRLLEARRGE
ncbi:metal-dependent hydrolase [Haloparvum sedimenti]|uniref:metal-dependent hydrolase n=1 Tax=Haloparvum sedimenti TaxID=1678448 RepID=UPI00071E7B26|nr:metal-dependent hydrolase [Haloparvum sedimenti]